MRMTLVEGVLLCRIVVVPILVVGLSFVLFIIMEALAESCWQHHHHLYPGVLGRTCPRSVSLWGH